MRVDPDDISLSVGLSTGGLLYATLKAIFEEEEPFEEINDHKEHIMDIQYIEGYYNGLLITIGLDQTLYIRNNYQQKLTMEMDLDFYPQSLIVDQGNNKIIIGGVNSDLETYELYEIDMCPFMNDKKDGEDGEIELVPNFL